MRNAKKIHKVIIIEPSDIISCGLKKLLETGKEFEVIATFSDGCHYSEKISSLRPDIIILNPLVIDFRQRLCIENVVAGICPARLVALVYQYVDSEVLKHYRAVLQITDDREKIVKKLLQLADMPEENAEIPEGSELSDREKEILVSIAKGRINKEIAEQHHISVYTVISHRKNITRKTGIKSVSGLTVYAILNNLIDINEVE